MRYSQSLQRSDNQIRVIIASKALPIDQSNHRAQTTTHQYIRSLVNSFICTGGHHHYSAADVCNIMDAAVRSQAAGLVTTEKDAVRWPGKSSPLPVYSLVVRPVIDDAQELIQRIQKLVPKASEDA